MKTTNIKDKLVEFDVTLAGVNLGDFDFIGELTAKQQRDRDNPDYAARGAFFRANYERGILLYYMIRQFECKSVLEIGTGRGYSTLCAARAMSDAGYDGSICTIDPQITKEYCDMMTKTFPGDWFKLIKFFRGTSDAVLTHELKEPEKFDIVIVDGDSSFNGISADIELVKNRWAKFIIIDDHNSEDVRRAVAQSGLDAELVVMDRQLYPDDRIDKTVNYGQFVVQSSDLEMPW